MADHHLTPNQREVLAAVADLNATKARSHARHIAHHSALQQVETAHALTELYQAKLIELRPGPATGSTTGWHLTAAGIERAALPA